MDAYALSITQASELIAAGELSPVELTESVLARIEYAEPHLNAFVEVTADLAMIAAKAAEVEIAEGGYRGPLHGIPLGVKDLYETAGIRTTSSSKVRADYVPDTDSTVVQKLLGAGMIMVGKTHTHEFALGGVTPTTRNPWHTGHIPGGSSGGSGAAVASGECMVGLGSDTGGSIRMPAALCGTVGLKPTYGLVSRRGVASLSWSLDHVGPLTRTVRDTALVMDAIAGYERSDPASLDLVPQSYTADLDHHAGDDLTGLTVGVPSNFFFDDVDEEVDAAVRAAIGQLEFLGARVVEVTIPMAQYISAAAQLIVRAEAAAYHRRMMRASGDLYTEQVRRGILAGEVVLATDYIDALRMRTLVQREWSAMVIGAGVDVIAAPTCPIPAPPADLGTRTWASGLVEDLGRAVGRYSAPANIMGLPGLSVPVGLSSGGLPIGMQLMGRPFEESTVLRVGQAYEQTKATALPVLAL
ncbi:MAG: Amidase [Propionibacteriaceae bacterium]|jgi:aspartyl-tRNA(Asn)/glutamyl-tRNA(Gln) amidotransferase subunit A|nr:Amidase [Propionibacteriaceae bacterium]